jgi:hypothetical protein
VAFLTRLLPCQPATTTDHDDDDDSCPVVSVSVHPLLLQCQVGLHNIPLLTRGRMFIVHTPGSRFVRSAFLLISSTFYMCTLRHIVPITRTRFKISLAFSLCLFSMRSRCVCELCPYKHKSYTHRLPSFSLFGITLLHDFITSLSLLPHKSTLTSIPYSPIHRYTPICLCIIRFMYSMSYLSLSSCKDSPASIEPYMIVFHM